MKEICASCKNGKCVVFGEKVNENLCVKGTCSCSFFKTEVQVKNDRLFAQKRLVNLKLEVKDLDIDGVVCRGTGTFRRQFCEFAR